MKFLYVLVATMIMLFVGASAQDHWICTCFRPAYDRGCCDVAKGTMMKDGNVCDIPGRKQSSMKKFEDCCTSINGTNKCK